MGHCKRSLHLCSCVIYFCRGWVGMWFYVYIYMYTCICIQVGVPLFLRRAAVRNSRRGRPDVRGNHEEIVSGVCSGTVAGLSAVYLMHITYVNTSNIHDFIHIDVERAGGGRAEQVRGLGQGGSRALSPPDFGLACFLSCDAALMRSPRAGSTLAAGALTSSSCSTWRRRMHRRQTSVRSATALDQITRQTQQNG